MFESSPSPNQRNGIKNILFGKMRHFGSFLKHQFKICLEIEPKIFPLKEKSMLYVILFCPPSASYNFRLYLICNGTKMYSKVVNTLVNV